MFILEKRQNRTTRKKYFLILEESQKSSMFTVYFGSANAGKIRSLFKKELRKREWA